MFTVKYFVNEILKIMYFSRKRTIWLKIHIPYIKYYIYRLALKGELLSRMVKLEPAEDSTFCNFHSLLLQKL